MEHSSAGGRQANWSGSVWGVAGQARTRACCNSARLRPVWACGSYSTVLNLTAEAHKYISAHLNRVDLSHVGLIKRRYVAYLSA